jgi:predicted transcriptional regulator
MANRITKPDMAKMVVMETLGHTPTKIAKEMGRSHHTVIAHLRTDLLEDPEVKALVKVLIEQELQDLTLINAKAREVLHRSLDEWLEGRKPLPQNIIPIIACIDRTLHNRRLGQVH